jgi:phosphonatase-like hydrolase
MQEIRLVVLDLGGTTVQDSGQVPAAFGQALQAAGIEVTAKELRAVRGAAKREAIRELIESRSGQDDPGAAILIERTYNVFQQTLRQRFEAGVSFVPGALEAISFLRSRDICVVLNTGFDQPITDTIVRSLAWSGPEPDDIVCGDDVAQGRPAPFMIFRAMERTGVTSVHQVMTVGDTVLDLLAGHNAGIRFNVGVLSGAHGASQLERAPHTHILPSVADLPALWTG